MSKLTINILIPKQYSLTAQSHEVHYQYNAKTCCKGKVHPEMSKGFEQQRVTELWVNYPFKDVCVF